MRKRHSVLAGPAGATQWGSQPELVGPRHAYRTRMVADHLARALPEGLVLDAGCGNGSLAILLTHRGYRVAGVDQAQGALAYAARRSREQEVVDHHGQSTAGPTLLPHLALADVTELPFADGAFDGAACGDVLEHVVDDKKAVGELSRVLRPGGVCVATAPAHPAWFGPLDVWAGHRRRYSKEALEQLFCAAGFTLDVCRYWGFPFMRLYERTLQRHLLLRGSQTSPTARLARLPAVGTLGRVLFTIDRLFDGSPGGTSLLLVARKERSH